MLESVPADRLESRNGALTSDAAFFFISSFSSWVHCPDIYCLGKFYFSHIMLLLVLSVYPSAVVSDVLYTKQAVQPRLDGEYKRDRMIVFLAWSLDFIFCLFSWLKPAGAQHTPIYIYSVQTNIKCLSAAFVEQILIVRGATLWRVRPEHLD